MSEPDKLILVYDGLCPFCQAYSRLIRLRAAAGELELVDARDGGPLLAAITARGIDIDEGMLLIAGEQWYHGSDALHVLALLSSRSGLFNRLNFFIFRSPRLVKIIYPVLRAGRGLALKLLGRKRINNLGRRNKSKF